MAKMKGAQILVEALKREGVKHLFGYPGGAVLPTFDVLYDSDIDFILTRHEQGAAHAADGYARASGRVGVCIATSGPGATNLVTGIATAYMDSVPVVAITGQVKTSLIGNDAFQEADVTGITRPITKQNYLVKDAKELARVIKEAFYIASTGRPGPVLVDLPVDVQLQEVEFEWPEKVSLPGYKPEVRPNPAQIKQAAIAIAESRRPVLYVGGGVVISGASQQVRELAEKCQIPVTTTLMALGAFPTRHPLSLGMLGMHGTGYANHAVMDADLIIAVGARFDDRVTGRLDTFAPYAKVVHIDIDPSSISKNIPVDIAVIGDAKEVLKELIEIVEKPDTEQWLSRIEEWKREFPLTYKDDPNSIKPQYVVQKLSELTNGEAIISTEVGQNQMWAAQYYEYNYPRQFISSGGLGTMGFGLPAAIGAKVGAPDRVVIDIAGDGSIQMNVQELMTAVERNIDVKVVILNNNFLGMVRQWQELFYNRRYSATPIKGPDFVKLAEAYGAKGIRVVRKEDVVPSLKEALDTPGVVLVDIAVEPEENVFPMVPAGGTINKMIMGMA